MVRKSKEVTKRINLLSYFDAFATLNVLSRDPIITSFVEHAVADLGFNIDLASSDLRNTLSRDFPGMVDVITDVVDRTLAGFGAERSVSVKMLAPFIYDIEVK